MAGRVVRQTGSGMAADWAERLFHLSKWRTNVGTELLAGLTTFMVMAYIIFVNPTILTTTQANPAALRPGITTATCLVAGLLCLIMGLYTNRALALAPGLGLNAVVAFQLVGAQKLTYQEAMGVIVAQGIVIFILVITGLRKLVMDAIPVELKRAISVGIGFFILFIGLVDAGIVVPGQGTPLTMGKLVGWPTRHCHPRLAHYGHAARAQCARRAPLGHHRRDGDRRDRQLRERWRPLATSTARIPASPSCRPNGSPRRTSPPSGTSPSASSPNSAS